jgi:hypothetical protein
MSKGQRGNKEAKKPRKVTPPAVPVGTPSALPLPGPRPERRRSA